MVILEIKHPPTLVALGWLPARKLMGRLSSINLHIKVACFVTKTNGIFHIIMSRSKLVRTRRSTVLSLPLQCLFLDSSQQGTLAEGEVSVQFTSSLR
jgi:hypothetical protein